MTHRLIAPAVISLILATLIVLGTEPATNDSALPNWLVSSSAAGDFMAADSATGAIWHDRFDPLLRLLVAFVQNDLLAFDLYRIVGLTLTLFLVFLISVDLGARTIFAIAAASIFAIMLLALNRIAPSLWVVSPWPAALVLALRRLSIAPSPIQITTTILVLVGLRFGSEPWFRLSLIPLAGWVLARGPANLPAALFVTAASTALWITSNGAIPAPGPTLETLPVPLTFRVLAAAAMPLDRAWAVVIGLISLVSFIADRNSRRPLGLAAILLWASFGSHVPTALRTIPPLHFFDWVPNGSEYYVPALLGVVAGGIGIILASRTASKFLPSTVGVLVIIAALASISVAALETPKSEPVCHTPIVPTDLTLAWPPENAQLAACINQTQSPGNYANLRPDTLPMLAPFLAQRPNPFWSEAFWADLPGSGIVQLHPLTGEVGPVPPGALSPANQSGIWRLHPAQALTRYSRLIRVEANSWTAKSDGASPLLLPEAAAFDGQIETRWGTGSPQRPGQYFELDLGTEVQQVTRIVLEGGPWKSDGPRHLVVSTLDSTGSMLILADYSRTEKSRVVVDFAPTTVRYLRLEQAGVTLVFDWSIAEIEVWQAPKDEHPDHLPAGGSASTRRAHASR